MPNSNLENSKTNMKTRIRNRVQAGQTPRDLGRLAKSARFVGLTDDAEVETDIDTQMAAAIPAASVDELVEMSEGLKELRSGNADMGRVSTSDNVTEGGNKFLKAANVQPAISVSGDLSYDSGVVSYTAPTSSALQVVATVGDLPTGASAGDQAVVQSNNKLYIRTADGWYAVALINTAPTVSGNDAAYTLATDGTATVITLTAVDPENDPVSFSHSVTSGALNGTTVSQSDNVFTVTPHASNPATFELTFSADDSVNVATTPSSFSLAFGTDWSSPTLIGEDKRNGIFHLYQQGGFNIFGNIGQFPNGDKTTSFCSYEKNGEHWIVFADPTVKKGSDTRGIVMGVKLDSSSGLDGYPYSDHWGFVNPNQYPDSSDQTNGDRFGDKIDASPNGRYVVVGAKEEWVPIANSYTKAGRAYVYNTDTNSYVTLDDPLASQVGNFGRAVAVNDTHSAVARVNTNDNSGTVKIFENSTGNHITDLTHSSSAARQTGGNTTHSDYFGDNMVMNNQYLCVAASGDGPADNHFYVGVVYVYDISNPASPTLLHTLNNPDYSGAKVPVGGGSKAHYAYFGGGSQDGLGNFEFNSMVVVGDKLAVGSPGNYTSTDHPSGTGGWNGSDFTQTNSWYERGGKIYIFDLTNGNMITEIEHPQNYGYGNITRSDGAYQLGRGIAFDGNVVVAGRANTRDVDIYSASDGSIVHTLVNAWMFTYPIGHAPAVYVQGDFIAVTGKYGSSYSVQYGGEDGYPSAYIWKP